MLFPDYKQQKKPLTPDAGETLLDLAQASIRHGLRHGKPTTVRMAGLPAALRQLRSTFVTLRLGSALRGCIGSIQARHPLAEDVILNAFGAAFRDPRFAPLRPREYPALNLHLSVLSDLETVGFANQSELLSRICPNRDGLLLEAGLRRGLLLPSVWQDLPDKEQFLRHLKIKAGLQADFWSDQIKIQRFTAQTFARQQGNPDTAQ